MGWNKNLQAQGPLWNSLDMPGLWDVYTHYLGWNWDTAHVTFPGFIHISSQVDF